MADHAPLSRPPRSSGSRRWFFTINFPDEPVAADGTPALGRDMHRALLALDEHHFSYLFWQLESGGTTGRLHLQGFVCFAAPKRLSVVKTLICARGHYEPLRGSIHQAEEYCSKPSDDPRGGRATAEFGGDDLPRDFRGNGPWSRGSRPGDNQGRRTDLTILGESIIAGTPLVTLATEMPGTMIRYLTHAQRFKTLIDSTVARRLRDVTVVVHNGPTGSGKSLTAFRENPDAYWVPLPQHNQPLWFDGYAGEETIIFDEFRPAYASHGRLLTLLGQYPTQVPMKGSMTWARWTKVIITCCAPWQTWYGPEDLQSGELARRITRVRNFPEDAPLVPTVTEPIQ